LPYHGTPIFRNLLSILPSPLPPRFKFLAPYTTALSNPPRHAIAYGAINNDGFFTAVNGYVLKVCHARIQHQTLLSFWASITAEAIAGRLDHARSGRKEIQRQRQEDVLLKILPLLKDGLSMHETSEMLVACFTFTIILASKSQLADSVLNGLMEAVTGALNAQSTDAGLICLSVLTQQKSIPSVSKKIVGKLAKVHDLETRLQALSKSCDVGVFTLALLKGALSNMRVKDQNVRFGLVERLLSAGLMSRLEVISAIDFLLELLRGADEDASADSVRDLVADLLRRLNESDEFSSLVADAVKKSGLDPAFVEASLQMIIDEPQTLPAEVDEMDVDSPSSEKAHHLLQRAIERVPKRTVDEKSFLSSSPSHLFRPLLEAFTLATQSKEGLQTFLELPLWKSSTDMDEPLFASFFVRVFSGPYTVQVRQAALSAVRGWLSKLSDFDSQAIIPCILIQLADPAPRIRKAASEVLLAMEPAFPSAVVDGEKFKQWGAKDVYGSGKNQKPLSFQATKDVLKILQRAVLPILEECILDPTQIQRAVKSALRPSSSDNRIQGKTRSIELKKYLRQSYFRLMLLHLLPTPLYSVKVGLLRLLIDVEKVGGVQKRKELMPLLLEWASLTHEKAEKVASAERLDKKEINSAMCSIISSTESDAVQSLLQLTSSASPKRSDFILAVTERVEILWPQLKNEQQIEAAGSFLDLIFHDESKRLDRSQMGRHVLQSVDLSTAALVHLLDNVLLSMNTAKEHSPSSKRIRNNEKQAIPINRLASEARFEIINKATFVLELIDNRNPETRPELLSGLFNVFAGLHQLQLRQHYLLCLSLGSLLSIVRNAPSQSSNLDLSAVHLDVILDAMRSTPDHQVQNAALLFIAAVATVSPERVLDSIMPVFTFMGTNVLGKEDEYSGYVVDQIMDKIIPPLVQSLSSRGQDAVAETADLVSSFVVAYEHIPLHRRLSLFKKLVSNLGGETFLWVIAHGLVQRYADQDDVVSFIVSLTNTFHVDIQLKACASFVVCVQDMLINRPSQQPALAEFEASDSASSSMIPLLRTLDEILTDSNIQIKVARSKQNVKTQTNDLLPFWKDLLGRMIRIVQTPSLDKGLSSHANDVLSSLLSLIPVGTLIDIAEYFLHAGPEVVGRKVLRLLESRLLAPNDRTSPLHTKAISFLPALFRVLESSEPAPSKHAALACVDRICALYGRKDVPAVVQAARVISGGSCLQFSDPAASTLALLCLSSLVESLKEAIIPVIPHMMPNIFNLLRSDIMEESEACELHNASFSAIAAVLANVPYIVANDEYLDQVLALSAESRNSPQNPERHEVRGYVLELISRNIEPTKVIGALQRTWATTVENDVPAVQQALSLLVSSIKASSKSTVTKNADQLFAFILQAMDLRRIQLTHRTEDSYTEPEVSAIETTLHSATLEIIYKLNDTSFRPVFLHLIDWATKCADLNPSANASKAKTLRQTSLFHLLTHFFSTLKSIVTSYGTHIVDPAIAALTAISTSALPWPSSPPTRDPDTQHLYTSTLTALTATLTHDQTSHFATPSLFHPLAQTLTNQLHLAPHPHLGPLIPTHVIPALVALATAVIDVPAHLKALGSLLCALRRHDDAGVRLASVRVHKAMLGGGGGDGDGDREALAVEWCANILSVGEGMVYVNEMLEDGDEGVEGEVRRLVRRVREVGGEEGMFD